MRYELYPGMIVQLKENFSGYKSNQTFKIERVIEDIIDSKRYLLTKTDDPDEERTAPAYVLIPANKKERKEIKLKVVKNVPKFKIGSYVVATSDTPHWNKGDLLMISNYNWCCHHYWVKNLNTGQTIRKLSPDNMKRLELDVPQSVSFFHRLFKKGK